MSILTSTPATPPVTPQPPADTRTDAAADPHHREGGAVVPGDNAYCLLPRCSGELSH